jgi:hypothetical protein
MGDNIRELPIDDLPPTHDEKEMIHWMFPEKPKPQPQQQPQQPQQLPQQQAQMTGKFHFEMKSLFIIIILYIALSNQWTDSLMNKILPMTTNSSIILTICKSIAFAIILMVFFNLYYKNI